MRKDRTTRLALCIGLVLLSVCSFGFSEPVKPALDEVLARVQQNVKEFEYSLPNFVCNERISSRELISGQGGRPIIVDSVFSGRQNDDKSKPFTESREIKAIDGRQAGKGQGLRVPVSFDGGFSSILDATFGERNIQYHNYKLAGTSKVDGREVLVIRFATKDDQQELYFEFLGRKFISKDTGTAWIDPESMQVVRLERRYLNLPPADGVLTVSVDYARVGINGKTFWMPATVRVNQTQPNAKKPVTAEYVAEYSNYQKFEVSAQMKY